MTRKFRNMVVCAAALAAGLGTASAQNFQISWFTVDGGGGTSTGGAYALSGTIGQSDAGQLTGGNYTLVGGFWSVIQQDGMPSLNIHIRASGLVLSWPASAAGSLLQSTTQLVAGDAGWSNFTGNPVPVGDRLELIVGPTVAPRDPIRFFRLHKP